MVEVAENVNEGEEDDNVNRPQNIPKPGYEEDEIKRVSFPIQLMLTCRERVERLGSQAGWRGFSRAVLHYLLWRTS